MAPRSGFIIKNGPDVFGLVEEAEPDALDFNLLGNHRYGVLSGCLVQMGSGLNVAIGSGIVIVNGAILKVAAAQVTLADPGQSARFDLIYVNNAGSVGFIRGTASPNPVFPEYADDVTILASVFVQPGTSPTQLNITDKRVFLPERYRTALDAGTLLGSYQTASLTPRFEIDYSGQHRWGGGALLWESSPLTLSVHADLNVEGVIGANDLLVQHDITVGGNITSDNLQRGSGPPSGTANDGDLYQDTLNGGLWTMEDGVWQRLSTVPIPVGTVSGMMRDDEPMGWLKLNGQKTQESRAGGLWALHPEWLAGGLLQLPDYTACSLRQGPIGNKGGTPTSTLREENLPPHKHLRTPSGTTQPAGSHSHNASIQAAGPHG